MQYNELREIILKFRNGEISKRELTFAFGLYQRANPRTQKFKLSSHEDIQKVLKKIQPRKK
jgi:hypothetical protein